MKKLKDAFSISIVVIVLILGILLFKDYEKESRFKKEKLGITLEIFKKYWGNPDKTLNDKSELVLIYNSNIIAGDKYVFKFSNQSQTLNSKFFDD